MTSTLLQFGCATYDACQGKFFFSYLFHLLSHHSLWSYVGHEKKNSIQMKSSNQFLLTRVMVEREKKKEK